MLPYAGEGPEDVPSPSWNAVEDEERYWEDPIPPEDFTALSTWPCPSTTGRACRAIICAGRCQGRIDLALCTTTMPTRPGPTGSPRWWQIYQPPYGEELHSTHFVAEETMAVIREGAERGEPWLAFCSFPDPHHPLTPPGDWFFAIAPRT